MKIKSTLSSLTAHLSKTREQIGRDDEGSKRTKGQDRSWHVRARTFSTTVVTHFDAEKALKHEHSFLDPDLYKKAINALVEYSSVIAESPKVKSKDSAVAIADAVSVAMKDAKERRNAVLRRAYNSVSPGDRTSTCLLLALAAVRGLPRDPALDCLRYLYHSLLHSDPRHRQNFDEYREFSIEVETRLGEYLRLDMPCDDLLIQLPNFVRVNIRSTICSMIFAQVLEAANLVPLSGRELATVGEAMDLAYRKLLGLCKEDWFTFDEQRFRNC